MQARDLGGAVGQDLGFSRGKNAFSEYESRQKEILTPSAKHRGEQRKPLPLGSGGSCWGGSTHPRKPSLFCVAGFGAVSGLSSLYPRLGSSSLWSWG